MIVKMNNRFCFLCGSIKRLTLLNSISRSPFQKEAVALIKKINPKFFVCEKCLHFLACEISEHTNIIMFYIMFNQELFADFKSEIDEIEIEYKKVFQERIKAINYLFIQCKNRRFK